MKLKHLATVTAFLTAAVAAPSWTATPLNPPSVPLAVRTPYLSAWLPQGAGTALNAAWPTFWTGQILGWAGLAKVDGTPFSFLGIPGTATAYTRATQKSFEYTSTQSTFVLAAGPVDLTIRFLSPVEPKDLLQQSIPFAYMAVEARSTDGRAHSVQIYSDISAEWVSGDNSLTANWTTSVGNIVTHQVQLVTQSPFTEFNDHTQYGSAFYSVQNATGVTYQTGQDTVLRNLFLNNGKLANTFDTNFRAISNNWPVFAFAQDLGSVGSQTTKPVVFSVGHIRDPAIRYITANNVLQSRSLYFWSRFSSPAEVISSFLHDYPAALERAKAFDLQVNTDASRISTDYAAVVALSIRQGLGALEITISKKADGSFDPDDVLVFMKEISSDGNMNTVDVIFPAWPLLLYTNPALGKYLLEGLFRYQATGLYPNKWSIHDLGSSYPNALGHNDGRDEAMPVEESGNMLIMSLSYFQRTGDGSQIKRYRTLLEQWTQFLIEDSLIPANQISTDDFAGPLANQTNLAIKGIIGIKAMSEIERTVDGGDSTKASNYSAIASSYVAQWQKFAISTTPQDHLTLSYGNQSSWGLSYNLFADKLLKLNLFPTSVYEMQTAWYKTVTRPFGIPLDTRHTYTKSDWEIWTSGIMTQTAMRDTFIKDVRAYIASGLSSQPFGDWYETVNGQAEGFRARPVVGGHLACALIQECVEGAVEECVSNVDDVVRQRVKLGLNENGDDKSGRSGDDANPD